jgi:hypothetical protein
MMTMTTEPTRESVAIATCARNPDGVVEVEWLEYRKRFLLTVSHADMGFRDVDLTVEQAEELAQNILAHIAALRSIEQEKHE